METGDHGNTGNLEVGMEKKHVVMVDDDFENPGIKKLFRTIFGDCEVTLYESGPECLIGLEGESHVDVFIVDYTMPLMNGVELFDEIRKIEKYKSVSVVCLTGYPEDLKSEIEKPGLDFFYKPVKSAMAFKEHCLGTSGKAEG